MIALERVRLNKIRLVCLNSWNGSKSVPQWLKPSSAGHFTAQSKTTSLRGFHHLG
jgi:hypothetical protein